MPPPQARERRRVLAGGAEGSGESGDARGLSAAGEGRDGAAGEAGAVAGTRISECRSQPARRPGRDVYGEPLGTVAELGALPGLDQRDRESAQRSATANASRLPVARRQDGVEVGGRSLPHNRVELSPDHGLPGSVDVGGGFREKNSLGRRAGGVKGTRTAAQPPTIFGTPSAEGSVPSFFIHRHAPKRGDAARLTGCNPAL